jgi:hypothetical protein
MHVQRDRRTLEYKYMESPAFRLKEEVPSEMVLSCSPTALEFAGALLEITEIQLEKILYSPRSKILT